MIKRRLLILAERLERISRQKKPKRGFSLFSWMTATPGENFEGTVCGTTACAIGEACYIRDLQRLGLKYDPILGVPVFKGEESWIAVQAFFGLSEAHATFLFSLTAYHNMTRTGPAEVAARIREFVAPQKVAA